MKPLTILFAFYFLTFPDGFAQNTNRPQQDANKLNIDAKVFDFGSVGTGTSVTQQVEIVNNSDKPLLIKNVFCSYHNITDPESSVQFNWTRKAIKPGKRGSISITYKAMSDIGSFKDEIAMGTGDSTQTRFYLTGAIVPVKDHPDPGYDPLTPLGAILGAVLVNSSGK